MGNDETFFCVCFKTELKGVFLLFQVLFSQEVQYKRHVCETCKSAQNRVQVFGGKKHKNSNFIFAM